MRELAEELKTDEGAVSYADRMALELAELLQAEEDKAAAEIERRQVCDVAAALVLFCPVLPSWC